MAAQIVSASDIKFGFILDYRCDNCFRNVWEDRQWFSFASFVKSYDFIHVKCPYCNAVIEIDYSNVDIPAVDILHSLHEQTGTWQMLFFTDQYPLDTITLKITGTIGKKVTVSWGDLYKTELTLAGGWNDFIHTYENIGNYVIKLFDPELAVRNVNFYDQNLEGTIDNLTSPLDLRYVQLRRNSFSGTIPDFTNSSNIYSLSLSENNLTGTVPDLSNLTLLKWLIINNNNLTGSLPALTFNTLLEGIYGYNNNLSGTFPGITTLSNLKYLYFSGNSFTGPVPDHSSNSNLLIVDFNHSSMTGSLASFSLLTVITSYSASNNSISNYTASTLSLTLVTFRMRGNSFPQSAVDQVLSDFNTNLASRPGSGTIWLDGTGMAAPSAAGVIHKNNIIAHGWTVLTN